MMTDTGQDIVVPDEMSVAEAEALQQDTQNRFVWYFTSNDNYMMCVWRNYYKSSNKRVKDENGAWKLLPIQKKAVRISI